MFPRLSGRFTVCAMDRRGHGLSSDRADYTLRKEAEDVAAVVDSRTGPVFVLGHSYGGMAALEAAFLTDRIARLVLYEPPLQDLDHSAATAKMQALVEAGDREAATVTFMREVVMVSPDEIAAMRARPSWPDLVASIPSAIRQDREVSAYRFEPARLRALRMPTLLLTGSKTSSPQLKLAIAGLMDALPDRTLVVLEGQAHNAMDTDRDHLAGVLQDFLLGPPPAPSAR
jgi:pimeloyl-ACP methyl ester carboxylesterase